MKVDKFILYIILVVIIAYYFPQAGTGSMTIIWDHIATYGVALIFFFYGLKLKISDLKNGLKNWKLHILIQVSTFILFPLIVLCFLPIVQEGSGYNMWLSFFFLAAVPSTVSSSVVMVSLAKGNVPAAIFNASLSGLIGIILTPLWLGYVVDTTSMALDYADVYRQLLLEIILPLILGILFQRWGHQWAIRHSSALNWFDKTIILVIVFKSFTHAFAARLFADMSTVDVVFIFIGVLLLFGIVYGLVTLMARCMRMDREDRITAQFCGTKKSLVHGTVFAKILFAGSPTMGVILLPLMVFHAFQIFIISLIATKEGNR